MTSSLPSRLSRLICSALLLAASGCYQPAPSDHAILDVSAAGELMFQGRPVERSDLQAAIAAAVVKERTLVVEIHASAQAPVALLEELVGTAKAAHAIVAFAGAGP